MTAIPEVILAREKGICYVSLCVVCNMAAGLQNRLTADEISTIYKKKELMISNILQKTVDSIREKRNCVCTMDVSKATL